jgi:radical SAM protein with 4Fe4S-binding SPASM domain
MNRSQVTQLSLIDVPLALPSFLQIEPVGQCNLKCRMCPVTLRDDRPATGGPAFMRFDHFAAIMEQFPHLRELHLQGMGEPMMHPQLFEMVTYAVHRGATVTTNSNLTLMSERRAEQCITSGLSVLHISLDGATAASYEDIRQGANFERVVENIHKVSRAKIRLGSDSPLLRLVVVVMRRNLEELPDLVRLAHQCSIHSIFVQHLSQEFGESSMLPHYEPMHAFVQKETLMGEDPHRVERYFAAARSVAAELAVELRLPRIQPASCTGRGATPHACDWPWSRAYVTYQGYAIPCCMIATPDRLHMGNMIEHGVETIWSGRQYQTFRNQLDSDEPPELCRACSVYKGIF